MTKKDLIKYLLPGFFLCVGFVPSAWAGHNVLGNPSFEDALGGANNWDDTAGRGILRIEDASEAPDGDFFLRLDESEVVNQFPFTFQTVAGVNPGDTVTVTGMARANTQAGKQGEIVIEFQTSGGAPISTEVATVPEGGSFQEVTVSAVAPADTGQITVVLRIENAVDDGSGTSTADFDDMFAEISAPAGPAGGTPVAAANVLDNPGIEEPLVGNWDATNGAFRAGAAVLAASSFASAPEGDFAMIVPDGAFTFQIGSQVSEGDLVTFSGFAQSTAALAGGGRLKIEFKEIIEEVSDTLISSVSSGFINAATAPAHSDNDYVYFEVQGVVPAGANTVVFVIETVDGGGGETAIDDLHATINPVSFNMGVTPSTAQPGGIVTVLAEFQNTSSIELSGVEFRAEFPSGFNVLQNTIRKNGVSTTFEEGSITVPVGTLEGSESVSVSFVTLITSGVTSGKAYNLALGLTDDNNLSLSREVQVVIRPDPVFEQGTIIGKVFHDINQNGVQDKGEKGVPGVRLVTEEGIVVVTDEHGRYSIPAVHPDRHLIKIDGRSLPEGTQFVTSENVLVRSTPGIMSKANFAVLLPPSDIPEAFQDDLDVQFTQGLDTTRPQLDVRMEPQVLKAGLGSLQRDAVFRFNINYPDFVRHWYLEVRDESGREVWTGFGVSSPPSEVTWTGQTAGGLLIRPGTYSYQLKVEDAQGRQDWTPLHFFRVVSKGSPEAERKTTEIPPVGNFNIFKDGKNSIPLIAKPTVRIQGSTRPENQIRINGRDIPVNRSNGRFHTEFYVTPGEKEYMVEAVSPEGQVTSYHRTMEVKDSTFFLVALGEQELGYSFGRGDLETAGNDGRFQDGFYEDGRLAYFFKGKLKGRFLVKSSYDTSDRRTELFRNLDPDKYYPVYGDDSSINYDAINTRQRLYLLIEMDRSFLQWGSFQTAFTDTELASYDRTLSGLKVHYETLDTTPYGDPVRGFKLFWSEARHRADHNEFAATGGSLYYLRHRHVIEGSEKVRVEIRDKLQGMTLESRNLIAGRDYQINYDEGRILLSRPLSSVAASDTITAIDILDGSPVFLVVDYEFDAGFDVLENANKGIRGYTHFGDHLRVGATAIKEKRGGSLNSDYDLRAVDMQVKFGRNTRITAEYAESKQQQTEQAVSFDGGITFQNLQLLDVPTTRTRENAALIKAESKPFKNMEVSGYFQRVDPTFSNNHIRRHEGTRKYGFDARYRFTNSFYARYRFDANEGVGKLFPLTEQGITAAFETRRNHIAQVVYDDGTWLGKAEYMRQHLKLPPESNLIPSVFSEFRFQNAITAKLGYRVNDSLFPYGKMQVAFDDKTYYQIGAGLRYQVADDLFAYVEETVGNMGDSTLFGLEKHHDEKTRSYANLRLRKHGGSPQTLSSTIGSSFALTEKSRVFTEREHSIYDNVHGYADIMGYEGRKGEHWDYELRFERRRLDSSRGGEIKSVAASGLTRSNTFHTASGAIGYTDGEKLRARTFLEGRRDSGGSSLWQWVNRNSVEYRVNEDLRYVGRLDFGKTRFTQTGGYPGDFLRFNAGFAYRPVEHDRFNMLARYSYLRNADNDTLFRQQINVDQNETAQILAFDFIYDLNQYLSLVEKFAYKWSVLDTSISDKIRLHHLLWVNRLNFHVTRKWDLALEYRMLWQFGAAKTLRQGALVEVDREFYEYVRLGVGYNFTDFSDDLSVADYDAHGPFVRLTGKF